MKQCELKSIIILFSLTTTKITKKKNGKFHIKFALEYTRPSVVIWWWRKNGWWNGEWGRDFNKSIPYQIVIGDTNFVNNEKFEILIFLSKSLILVGHS